MVEAPIALWLHFWAGQGRRYDCIPVARLLHFDGTPSAQKAILSRWPPRLIAAPSRPIAQSGLWVRLGCGCGCDFGCSGAVFDQIRAIDGPNFMPRKRSF